MKSGVYLNFSSRKTIKNDNAVVTCTLPLSMLTISQLAEVKQHCYSNFFLRGGAATPPQPLPWIRLCLRIRSDFGLYVLSQ